MNTKNNSMLIPCGILILGGALFLIDKSSGTDKIESGDDWQKADFKYREGLSQLLEVASDEEEYTQEVRDTIQDSLKDLRVETHENVSGYIFGELYDGNGKKVSKDLQDYKLRIINSEFKEEKG